MSAFSDKAENSLIDFVFRAQALGLVGATAAAGSGPATLYVGLVTSASTDAAPGTEVTGGNYARVPVTSSLAAWAGTQGAGTTVASSGSSGTTSNNAPIAFPTPTASWGTVVGFLICDSLTGGSDVIYSPLTLNQTIGTGNTVSFPAGAVTFQIDN